MNGTIFCIGMLLLFLIYQRNPTLVLWIIGVYVLWRMIQSGQARARNKDALHEKKLQDQRESEKLKSLRTIAKALQKLAEKTESEEYLEEDRAAPIEEFDHLSTN
jgi:hypothetical protein